MRIQPFFLFSVAAVCAASMTPAQDRVTPQGTVLDLPSRAAPMVNLGERPIEVPPATPGRDDSLAAGRRGVRRLDGRLWGYGRAYRAGFEPGVVEFTPAYGEDSPRNLPLRFRLDSVRRGAAQFLVADATAEPMLIGDHVEYLRQDGVRERYECRNEGMELSLVFEERIAGSGDLVVRMALDSELQAPGGERLTGLAFDAAPFGAVTIGGVTGIDADGRECTGWLNHRDGWLEMVLPAEFVDRAAWPLVLDPLVGNLVATGVSFDDIEPDVAYDASTDFYLTTYTYQISAADFDVLGQRHTGDNATRTGNFIPIGAGAGRQRKAAVGNVQIYNYFGVAWQTDAAGNWDIMARGVNAADGSVGAAVAIANSGNDEIDVAVSGESSNLDDDNLIAWQDVGGVGFRACQFTPDIEVAFDYTDIGAPAVARGITISQHPNAAGDYLFAWETENATDWYIGLQIRDRNLDNPAGTALLPGSGHGLRGLSADAIGGDEFYLVYGRRELPGDSGLLDVWASRIVRVQGTSIGGPGGLQVIKGDPRDDESQPTVAYLGDDKVVVGWRDMLVLGAQDSEIRMVNILPLEARPCGRQFGIRAGILHASSDPKFASKASAGAASDEAMLSWATFDLASGNQLTYRVLWEGMGSGGPVRNLGGGCGPSGTAAANGPFAFGNRDFAFTLTGSNNGSSTLAACSISFNPAPSFFRCGPGCALMPGDFSANVAMDAMGNAELAVPVGCRAQFFGLVLNAQFVVYTPSFNPCGIAPVSVSNTVQVVLGD